MQSIETLKAEMDQQNADLCCQNMQTKVVNYAPWLLKYANWSIICITIWLEKYVHKSMKNQRAVQFDVCIM